jgi:hypothetical protein
MMGMRKEGVQRPPFIELPTRIHRAHVPLSTVGDSLAQPDGAEEFRSKLGSSRANSWAGPTCNHSVDLNID